MRLKKHIAYSLPVSAGLYLFWDTAGAIYFLTGAVLVDVDHVFEYWVKTKDLNPRRMLEFYERLAVVFQNQYYLGLSVLHTVEFMAIMVWWACYSGPARFILAGLLYHHLLDTIRLMHIKCLFKRSYSIFYYIFKTRIRPDDRFKEVIRREGQIFREIIQNGPH